MCAPKPLTTQEVFKGEKVDIDSHAYGSTSGEKLLIGACSLQANTVKFQIVVFNEQKNTHRPFYSR